MTRRWAARELPDLVLDPGSFVAWDTPVDRTGLEPSYLAQLRAAEEGSGVDESVLTGRGLVHGRPVAVVVNEFGFLAGSIGLGEALAVAVAAACGRHLALLRSS